MIITSLQFVRLYAWIFKGQWMWHLDAWGQNARWSRLQNFAEEYEFFTCCEIEEHK